MEWPANNAALVAVDLGAQSCRVSLLRLIRGAPEIQVIHRFSNAPTVLDKGLQWDIGRIVAGVEEGLRLCNDAAPEGIASIGIDGWAVDYVRLDSSGRPLWNPFCYRDERTTKAVEEVYRLISPEKLYALTGIQLLSLNTLYQLYADKLARVDSRARWLNLPEYVTHLLGGRPVSEYTNATHTQLVALETREWCKEIFDTTGLDRSAAPEIVPTGTLVGTLQGELSRLAAFQDTKLIVPACHDTASAIAAIPATGEDWAFISSGTWSLVGTVLQSPCVTEEARRMNFTNLGGVGGTTCFLKNVNGMWLLRQCMDEWEQAGHVWSVEELLRKCENLPTPETLIDVDDGQLMLPGNMPEKINAQLRDAGSNPLGTDERGILRMASVIFHSLAKRYAEVLDSIARIAQKKLKRLFIVGGGSKNEFLNRLTAERTGLEVLSGSSECSTLGNFAIQIAALHGEGNSSKGVNAGSVAHYAKLLSSHSLSFLGD
jgi:rhamnulokinase